MIYKVYLTEEVENDAGMSVRRFKNNGPYADSVTYIDA
jgi:hypothetical protein